MQKQCFQARLGDVNVVQFGARACAALTMGPIKGPPRPAYTSAEYSSAAHLGDAGQLFQFREHFLRDAIEAQPQQVAAGNRGFSSAGVPCEMMRPWSMMARRSHSVSASSI